MDNHTGPSDDGHSRPAPPPAKDGIGILGAGTVGTAVLNLLSSATMAQGAHGPHVVGVAIRDPHKQRPAAVSALWLTTDALSLANHPDVTILIDVMGGEEPALTACLAALDRGVPVITANKALLSAHWDDLQAAARTGHSSIHFSACVGGAVPMVELLEHSLAADQLLSLAGVLNATSNLTLQLAGKGQPLPMAIETARALGMAEADPSRDLSGQDALDKAQLLSRIAWPASQLLVTMAPGVDQLSAKTAALAKSLGLCLRPIAVCSPVQDSKKPAAQLNLVRIWCGIGAAEPGHPLASLTGMECGLVSCSDLAGITFIKGTGAGGIATASAVLSDLRAVLEGSSGLARNPLANISPPESQNPLDPPRLWLAIGKGTVADAAVRLEKEGFPVTAEQLENTPEKRAFSRPQIFHERSVQATLAHSGNHWACLVTNEGAQLSLEAATQLCSEDFSLLPVLQTPGNVGPGATAYMDEREERQMTMRQANGK